jgi:tetratricopeptide (TPR) repeat protein/tRNA A-37 threonylcarbamoyl transferase component Bud32
MSDLTDNSDPASKQNLQPGAPYKKGDFIGQKYEVYGILGQGGFGIVYLVYSHETSKVYALKTFKDEYLADQEVRERFQKEAGVWVELGRHPYLVHAYFVEEISGRLYIGMEYIAPNEGGLNLLDGYLQRQLPDLAQSMCWGIQICHGMEYAYSKGVRAHRDLKPANIMITQDKTAKITDFGLAGVLTESPAMRDLGLGAAGLSGQTMLGTGFGTPTHMAPEQFDNAALCDERSDIYSFGIMLYQMAAGGQVPFLAPLGADFWQAMRQLHRESPVPRLDSPLFPIIQRCLEKSPEKRYQTFKEVRTNLEPLLLHQTGEVVIPPQLKELETWEWTNKGVSLNSLGHFEEALHCYDKALALDPHYGNAWTNKGNSLHFLGHDEDALHCYDKALEFDPHNVNAWNNKGLSLGSLGRYEEAIRCCDKALALDPHDGNAWTNKGNSLHFLGHDEDALHCYDKALEFDPRYVNAWNNKGLSLGSLGRYEEAISCYEEALKLDPRYASAWTNKGNSLHFLGHDEDALHCYDKALELDPRNVNAWNNKGLSLGSLGRYEEAISCYEEALKLDPRNAITWSNKGASLDSLGRHEEAIVCYDEALRLDPRDAVTWSNKALAEDRLSRWREAVHSFQQFMTLAPAEDTEHIEYARKHLRELEGK